MLEQLFGSKTRVHLLRLLLNDPGEAFYVREMTRRLGAQINAVRTELIKLVNMDLVIEVDDPAETSRDGDQDDRKRTSSRQKKFFRINTDCLIYPELQALFVKARVLLEKNFIRKLSGAGSISYLALTGIFTGEEGAPTDMLIVGRIKRDKLAVMIRAFEREISKEINYTVMTPQEFRYRKDVTDRFLYSILEAKKLTVIDTLTEAAH